MAKELKNLMECAISHQDEQILVNPLSVIYDGLNDSNPLTDIDTSLEFIIQKTKELLDAVGASILFFDHRKSDLYFPVVVAEEKEVETRLKQLRLPIDSGIAGLVFRENKPVIVSDVNSEKHFYKQIDKNTGFATKSILCIPLHVKGSTFGVFEVVNKKKGEFTEIDRLLLEIMSVYIVMSIENEYLRLQRSEVILRHKNVGLSKTIKQNYHFENIIGDSNEIINVLRKVEQVAPTNATVMIYGETGTGKELIAKAIHQISSRSPENFVPVNCCTIPDNLLESELFGHEKGAFTNAITRQVGRFKEANGGTIFFDEIGDMPLHLQGKLLRVLEEHIIRPLGSNQNIPIDVRVIAATNHNLADLVAEGKFRQDLYYRLNVFELELPSLRKRKKDIPLLIRHFIKQYNEDLDKQIFDIEDEALDFLCNYDYPGNIRELQNIIESAMILSEGNIITIFNIPQKVRLSMTSDKNMIISKEHIYIPKNGEELKVAKDEAQQEVERLFLMELLSRTRGNVSEAARQADMNRSWLAQLVSKHRLGLDLFSLQDD
ncbi:MAG: Response regulator [Candidatus Poribacteria bacterium]|nr:Response regulator [Candidatus Poribacteria bacterium]